MQRQTRRSATTRSSASSLTIVQQQGRPSPSPEVPSKNVNAVETLVGDYWSRAVADDGSPKDLANELLEQLVPLLKG